MRRIDLSVFSSPISRIFSTYQDCKKYRALVEPISAAIRDSVDLSATFEIVATEIARALNVARCAILLRDEHTVKLAADHSASAIKTISRERLSLIDAEITRNICSQTHITEMSNLGLDPRIGALLPSSLNGKAKEPGIKSVLVAPIILNSETVGAIVIYRYRQRRRFSVVEKEFLQVIASHLSLGVYQAQLRERAKTAADREALTSRLLAAIRSAAGVDAILKVAVESLGAALGVTRAVIYTRADDKTKSDKDNGSRLTARDEYRASLLVPSVAGSALDIEGSPLLGQLIEGEIITVPDTSHAHPIARAIGVRVGVRALAFAPITFKGRLVAALALEQFDGPREFSLEEIGLIRLVSEQAAVALHHAELYREAEEAARREALIRKISSTIHGSLDPDAALQAIVNELGAALSVCRCRLALLTEPMPEYIAITHSYIAPCCLNRPLITQSIPVVDNPHLQAMLSSTNPLAIDDVMAEPKLAHYRERFKTGGVKSLLSTTIRLGERPIGVFSLHHCESRRCWTQWEIDVVQSVAEHAAVAIRQAELYREARESATRADLVNQVVASIRRSLDLQKILQVTVEELGRALGASRTNFRKLNGGEIEIVAEHLSDPSLSIRDLPPAVSNHIIELLIETRRALAIDDIQAFIAASSEAITDEIEPESEPASLSAIVSPIFINENFWGGLAISQSDRIRNWTAGEIALVEQVTAQVEVAINHSRLFEEARQAAQIEALISHIIHRINEFNRPNEIFPVVAREIGEHLATDALLVSRLDAESKFWTIECEYRGGQVSSPKRSYRDEDFTNLNALADDDGVIRCDDVECEPRLDAYLDRFFRPVGTRAFMSVRLAYDGTARLAITAIMRSGPRVWTDDEVKVLRAAADQLSIAFERIELFEQVSRGKHEWEATFDALADGVFIFDQRGVLRRVNEAGAAFEGKSARELIGCRCCSLLQGIENDGCRVAPVIETARPVTFELVPERLNRPVLVTISPFTSGQSRHIADGDWLNDKSHRGVDQNGTLGAVCIVRDLSELRAAEAAAREQRSFLVKLIEHANEAIFALSPEGEFVWFNDQLVKLSGYSREELSASDYRRFLTTDGKKLAVERFTRALAGQAQVFELHGIKKSGEARLLLVTYTPIYDEGRVTSVLSVASDITEERLASERAAQADKLRALGQLASGVAHNFNNVLAAILGHAQLIKRDSKDECVLQRVDIIERAALDGAQTVKRIQGFGLQHDDSGHETIDVNQIVQDSANLTQARWRDDAQARGLRYEVEIDLQPVPALLGSASEMREVFVNIILNALDAMPQGGDMKITTEATDAVVRVSFIDSGVGMSREVRARIFEPFFTTKGVTGMGLGLAVSHSIVERHGGRIEARSNPGRGSTFTITLPLNQTAVKQVSKDRAAQVAAANILVIDDDEMVREALVGMLNSAGHRTDQAANGREALAKIERSRFDLIFTDLSMPEMDGWAVANEIRRRRMDVKIVLITGFSVASETVKTNSDLVNAVIFKPIRLDDISATLNQILS